MKSVIKKIVIVLALFVGNSSSFAGSSPLIAIDSEAKPGQTAYLGVNFDDRNVLTGIYYLAANKSQTNFSLQEISEQKVFYKKKGYDLVLVKFLSPSPASSPTSVKLALVFQKNVFDPDYGNRVFTVAFNKHLSKYEIYDEKGRQITKAFATSHKNSLGMTVGIDDFKTQ